MGLELEASRTKILPSKLTGFEWVHINKEFRLELQTHVGVIYVLLNVTLSSVWSPCVMDTSF